MKPIVTKFDEETIRELDELAEGSSRSDMVREAVRQYICTQKVARRKREVEEYMRQAKDREALKCLAESDMDHAAELLDRTESER